MHTIMHTIVKVYAVFLGKCQVSVQTIEDNNLPHQQSV